jgi:dienelactone hydrolase
MTLKTESLEYFDADGKRYVGFLAVPERPAGPAVLVAHNAPGVSDFERGVALKLAELGYVAFCADYTGDGAVLTLPEIGAKLGPLMADSSPIRGTISAALATLIAQPGVDSAKVAAIGYCFGGTAVLELARGGANVAAVVGLHAGLPINRPEDARNISGKVLILSGAADPMVPPEMRSRFEAQMNEAGIDWQMHLYGGVLHAFTVPGSETLGLPGMGYHATTDARSWKAMLQFFKETIGL